MQDILKIKVSENEEKEFSIISTFDINEKNKSYVVYTDYSTDENGNINISVSSFNKYNELIDVTDEDEIRIIDEYLQNLLVPSDDTVII